MKVELTPDEIDIIEVCITGEVSVFENDEEWRKTAKGLLEKLGCNTDNVFD